jgi:hypothetical protein
VFGRPARLAIVPAKGSPSRMVGLSYDGSGSNVTFKPGAPAGDAFALEVEHFSGEAAFERTLDAFLVSMGDLVQRALAGGVLNQAEVEFFIDTLRAFRLTLDECHDNPTCAFLDREARKALIQLGEAECVDPEHAVGSELVSCIWDGLRLEGDFQLLGLDDPDAQAVIRRVHDDRRRAIDRLVEDVEASTARDPMGDYANEVFLTPRHRGVGRITDREPDGHVSNAEIALGLGGNLALLGDDSHTNRLTAAVDAGLRAELERAKRLCETDVRTAKARLERLLGYAGGQVRAETAAAIVACVPKVRITPAEASVVFSGTQAFTATANDGETTFSWSASAGSISQAGVFTAPAAAGDVTVTVALPAHPDVRASAVVHVTPSGYRIDDDEVSLSTVSFVGCEGSADVLSGGRTRTSGLGNLARQQYPITVSRSRPAGTTQVEGLGQMELSGAVTSSPLRLAAGLGVGAAASTDSANAGGADGIWLLVRGTMDFDFSVGVASTAACTADFLPGMLRVVGDPHVTIGDQATPAILDLGPSGHVEDEAVLPPGEYHLSAFASYQGDDTTPPQTGSSGAVFSFSCEITPA